MLYLLARLIFKHKFLPETWLHQEKFPPEEESVFAQRHLVNLFLNQMVPLLVNTMLLTFHLMPPHTFNRLLTMQLNLNQTVAFISLGC
jgi:hypothetical protein